MLKKRHGNHLVNGLHSVNIETVKISSGGSGGISVKFCNSENFPLYGSSVSMSGGLPSWRANATRVTFCTCIINGLHEKRRVI